MSEIQIPGWSIRTDHHSAFVRTHVAVPDAEIEVEYATPTIIRGRHSDATFVGRVLGVNVRHQWDQQKEAWWGSGNLRICLINPNTGERYKSGWKADEIPLAWVHEGVANADDIVKPIMEALRPRTRIRVIEEAIPEP
jgi:hypothetical protein